MARDRRKVVWFEGMTLDPHHLQQWDTYQQGMLSTRIRSLTRYDWGLTGLEIDRERLANGEFWLIRCSGVMPDGLPFDIPGDDPAPAPRSVQEAFNSTASRLGVYLAIPAERRGASNYQLQGNGSRRETRFLAETLVVPDDNTGVDERPIEVARLNLQIRFSGEPLDAYTTIQIAEVRREPGGSFTLDDGFIPPCQTLAATQALSGIARRLLELLVAKSLSIEDRAKGVLLQRELSPADVSALGLLSTVNCGIPLLHHLVAASEGHPEQLYRLMLLLAAGLSVHVPESRLHPRDYPLYDHAAPTACFTTMDRLLRDLLGGAKAPTNYLEIPLQLQREGLYTGQLDDGVLQDATLYVVAQSDQIPEDRLIRELPAMMRIAAPTMISALLQVAVRALPIEHTTRLPAGMPVDPKANYFLLQKRGLYWEAIRDAGGIAIYLPAEYRSLAFKLVAAPHT